MDLHPGAGGSPGGCFKVIHIPNETCGRIIGKGGAAIQQLEAQSGANIKMQNEKTPGSSTRPLTLEGSPHAIAAAERLIMDKVNEAQQRLTGTWKGCVRAPPTPPPAVNLEPMNARGVRNTPRAGGACLTRCVSRFCMQGCPLPSRRWIWAAARS